MTHPPPGVVRCPYRGEIGAGRCVELQATSSLPGCGLGCLQGADPREVAEAMAAPVRLAWDRADRNAQIAADTTATTEELAEWWGVCERTVQRARRRA